MRTKLQKKYDAYYYGLERRIFQFYRNLYERRATRGLKMDDTFRHEFKTKVLPYWKQYGLRPGRHWYKHFYALTGEVDPRYIPESIHHRYIIPYFNNLLFVRALSDKNLHSLLFPNVCRPETMFKYSDRCYCNDDFTPISREEALGRCLQAGQYILKPTRDTGEGHDICFFSDADGKESISALLNNYTGTDYIVQRVLAQHPALAALNPTSVNTIRIVTAVYHGKAHILSAILRIGNPGSRVDNIAQGGYQAVIRPDGTLAPLAYTRKDGKDTHVSQTDTGFVFENFAVPYWDDLRQTVSNLALRLPHLKLLGWDFAINDQGRIVLIEFNCDFVQNQENCGPTFGDMTDEILDEIFKDRKKDIG